jgi:hydroxypyruvate isomerase
VGYDGWFALEYQPTTTTEESLDWLELKGPGCTA